MKTKNYLTILLFSVLFLVDQNTNAQGPSFGWAKSMGAGAYDVGYTILSDEVGNVYTAGYFSDTVDFDPGPGIYNMVASLNGSSFIQKLDSAGNLIWAKSIDNSQVSSMILDDFMNIYITGSFSDTVDFNPGIGIYNLASNGGGSDVYLLKLDSAANFILANSVGGINSEYGSSIKVDSALNIYLTGTFNSDSVDFDPGLGSHYLYNQGAGYGDPYILKLDSLGKFVWAKSFGETGDDGGYSIAIDLSQNVYVTGYFIDTVDFDPGAGTYYMSSVGLFDSYVVKLNSLGNFVWAKAFLGVDDNFAYGLALDKSNNVFVTGEFEGTIDFNPGSSIFNLTSSGTKDIFVAKLNSLGDFEWATSTGGLQNDGGWSITTDFSGSVYTTGWFYDTVDFDPGSGIYNLGGSGMNWAFIQKLDKSGNFVWAKVLEGSYFSDGYSVHTNSGNVYLTGDFFGTTDFDPDTGVFNLTCVAGTGDIYILKLQCANTTSTINPTECDSYTSPSGFYTWNTSGIYTDIIPNAIGCDSVITINLTINNADTSVTVSGVTLTATSATSTYQWIDCGNGNTPIAGETNQSFSPTADGNYAVVVTENGCTDTSACYNITGVGMDEIAGLHYVAVYPNPVEATAYCDFQLAEKAAVKITVRDMLGKEVVVIKNQNLTTGMYHQRLDLSALTSGIYFLHISINDGDVVRKVIKQ